MTALALRGIGQRKLRSVLTAIAILLGVAMIAGTYVQTDQIRAPSRRSSRRQPRASTSSVTPKEAFTATFSDGRDARREALIERGARRSGRRRRSRASCGVRCARRRRRGARRQRQRAARSSRPRRAEPFNPSEPSTGGCPARRARWRCHRTRRRSTTSSSGDRIGIATRARRPRRCAWSARTIRRASTRSAAPT